MQTEIENEPDDEASSLTDTELARRALRAVLVDPLAPAASRAQAARTLAEIAGALGRHAQAPREALGPLTDMTPEQLRAELLGETGGHLPGITAEA